MGQGVCLSLWWEWPGKCCTAGIDSTEDVCRPASVHLSLVARVDSIDLDSVKQHYQQLCDGLGLVQLPFTIRLRPDAKPVSLKVQRPHCLGWEK